MRLTALFQRARRAKVAQVTYLPQSQASAPSSSRIARAGAATAAILLLIASAGFGCVFALTQGLHHGPVLAVFALTMALGLEVAKPFAVESVFTCFRTWAIGRGLVMLLLAAVAIGYSLTAELSLMAMTRGDAAAGRSKVVDSTKDDRADLVRVVAERSSMTFFPATGESVSASREMVAAAERTRKAECGNGDPRGRGKNCRARETEEAAAHTALAAVIASKTATDRAKALDARADAIRSRLAQAPATAAADPGAAALATFLGIFGVTVDSSLLAQWLVLVGVFALEIGSALAVVLVRAAGSPQRGSTAPSDVLATAGSLEPRNRVPDAPTRPERVSASVSKKSPKAPQPEARQRRGRPAKERLRAEAKVIDLLKARGGKLSKNSTTRKLGKMAGVRKSTMHMALAGLLASGVLAKVGGALVLNG